MAFDSSEASKVAGAGKPLTYIDEKKQLEVMLRRFHPLVGEGEPEGHWLGDFRPGEPSRWDQNEITSLRVRRILLEAGVPEYDISMRKQDYPCLAGNPEQECLVISEASYRIFEAYVKNKLKEKAPAGRGM